MDNKLGLIIERGLIIMKDIEIYFIGGTSCRLYEVLEESTDKLVEWLDNNEDTHTFKIDINSAKKTKILRKEMILFIDVYDTKK